MIFESFTTAFFVLCVNLAKSQNQDIDCSMVNCKEGYSCRMTKPTCGAAPLPLCYSDDNQCDGELKCCMVNCKEGYHCGQVQSPTCASPFLIYQCLEDQPPEETTIPYLGFDEITCSNVTCNPEYMCLDTPPPCGTLPNPKCWKKSKFGPSELNCTMISCTKESRSFCRLVQNPTCDHEDKIYACVPS